ncbi:unnamed protein product [Anisakis simplex]|uniref:MEF2_binding domain-containing protein n=2 Tax=Anisakis simplex TaxID=6269 RepID=A0A0M3JDT8_ANISI|nr:unnamed protein product [Anisakis simplex]
MCSYFEEESFQFRDIDMRYEMHLKSPCGPAAVILVNKDEMLQQQFANLSGRFQSIPKNVFSDEPGQILEDEDDEGAYLKKRRPEDESNDPKGPEVLRRLSPPPSERDYIFNLNQGESLLDLYQDDTM